ncbi:Tyrosine-protein phosphatase non-receptor type 13 [Dufourea novaeangliae]|uniref:Tyrosine-protein phosphatase non-receptor type 13 n=1 Tax=Dufourea novaeangliae TaxID=178035 RepID=A0A154NY50_DUFNO|nr:Tyrosine-protein phosphatase non-receptor type 13 [Dufourea novaeangliae]
MGSNLSRHSGKGLTGRRTQSSGNLCDPKGKLNSMGKILVPCSSAQRERYKFCGSLPNHLDDKDVLDDDPKENNNIMTDTMTGNLGGTLPHKKRSLGVHFSDGGPTGALDLVKHRSQDSIDENDPWRYQQSDLDLVRCRHGNFDSVRRNRSTDAVSSDTSRRYARGSSVEDRCHRNSDLDLVGTLPKRKQDTRNSGNTADINSSSSQPSIPDGTDGDLLMQIVHKPDCELVRHRQQLNKCIDLKLSKLAGGEPQDQGYASERSPEDEHPPSLPGQPFPNITPESTFRVTLQKSSRGLGLSVSGGGTAGPVRVKRLFPQQPAALSNKLQPGDILLAANGIPLTGLTNYEALEVLRTTPSTVELVVCRLPGDTNVTPPGAPPPPPTRREPPPPLRILNPLPPLQIEPCGEFDIEMTKVGGSLGFTLRKADSSALGHYVRALVREPALSDGRIRPGDKIVAVDGAPLSPMSHEEAVQLLRQCGPTVRLRLYRDLAQTPVSALSPTEPDHPLRPPRTSLRQEAVDMTPRNKFKDLEKHSSVHTMSTASQAETSDSDQCSIRTQITNSQPNTPGTDIIDPPPLYDVCDSSNSSMAPARPSFLDLTAPQGKPHFQFCSLDSDLEYPGGDGIVAQEEGHEEEQAARMDADYERRETIVLSSQEHDNDLPSEPASMPPVLSSTSTLSTAAFSYKNPAYQSANPACGAGIDNATKTKVTHSSDQDIPGKILGAEDPGGSKGLLKWKGVMFAPDDGIDKAENEEETVGKDTTDSAVPSEELEQGTEVFMVELTRGWNSRLGFSLQPEGNHTVISVVHPDSVAAKDGRLKQGDVLLMWTLTILPLNILPREALSLHTYFRAHNFALPHHVAYADAPARSSFCASAEAEAMTIELSMEGALNSLPFYSHTAPTMTVYLEFTDWFQREIPPVVNDESVKDMSTADIIDLLRKIRGSIGITVMRRSKRENVT